MLRLIGKLKLNHHRSADLDLTNLGMYAIFLLDF
jgi:hypothetical protein